MKEQTIGVVGLGQQKPQAPGHAQVAPERLQRLGVQGGHVDRLPDRAGRECDREAHTLHHTPNWGLVLDSCSSCRGSP